MNRKPTALFLALTLLLTAGCTASADTPDAGGNTDTSLKATSIVLADSGVTVDGTAAPTDSASAVYTGADIVYYETGRDETYGAGTDADGHDEIEAAAHTVVTITRPGVYRISGAMSRGQLAVDLGETAADPDAVVTLILDGVDLTCTVAPAVLFYNVYECGSADTETANATVDTSGAGANVILADGSVNNITGSYVAKIYKEGTEKKLHKYDGAFYSRMSMNVTGGEEGTGVLNITAENEGLDSELHLTINGGNINITAQNDGINTNEDGVSVTTINGGALTISAGLGEEGDGIDSNGYLVINGGTVITAANGRSGDGGIDSDMGIYLNGGTVLALGSRNDSVESLSAQPFMELSFAATLPVGSLLTVKNAGGETLFDYTAEREFSSVTLSSGALSYGETYSVYVDGVRQQYTGVGSIGGMGGGMRPGGQRQEEGGTPPELPEGMESGQPPEGMTPPDGGTGTPPEDMTPPDEGGAPSGDQQPGGRQGGGMRPGGMGQGQPSGTQEGSTEFVPTSESHGFFGVSNETTLEPAS